MMDKVEMSLDDIIKQTKGSGRRGRGGGARRGGGGGGTRVNARGGVTPLRNRRGGRFSTPRTPFSRESRVGGDINSRWQHDMYDGPAFNRKRGAGGLMSGGGGPSKLVVSNLDYGVSTADIQELFSEFGPIKNSTVNYDKSGRSTGSANVVFERRSDAVKALKQYNNVPLDGRPMHIELTISDVGALIPQANRLSGGFNRRRGQQRVAGRGSGRGAGGFRRGGGRGGLRGRGNKSAPTAEQLDKELDAYVNKIK